MYISHGSSNNASGDITQESNKQIILQYKRMFTSLHAHVVVFGSVFGARVLRKIITALQVAILWGVKCSCIFDDAG